MEGRDKAMDGILTLLRRVLHQQLRAYSLPADPQADVVVFSDYSRDGFCDLHNSTSPKTS